MAVRPPHVRNKQPALRWGFSTGACAAGLARAAWLLAQGEPCPTAIAVLFFDGKERTLPLFLPEPLLPAEPSLSTNSQRVAMRKDGGDDPDCTHGAILYATLCPSSLEKSTDKDYCLFLGTGTDGATVILRAVEGIGLCTRVGLDCEQGKWAINSGPRQMIVENLRAAGLTTGCWLLELGIEHGETLAQHTLNPHLGIVGGLSILGTTGFVRPYSHDAYIETVRLCVRSHAVSGGRTMVFCTGGRTQAGARRMLPDIPETGFTCIGDFIAESLTAAVEQAMQRITVVCMPGKLCKYAAGFTNTHAHKVRQDMQLFRNEVQRLLPSDHTLHATLAHCVTVREALLALPRTSQLPLLQRLAARALEQFTQHCAVASCQTMPELRVLVFDFAGHFLMEARA